jgi:hypothetical protein
MAWRRVELADVRKQAYDRGVAVCQLTMKPDPQLNRHGDRLTLAAAVAYARRVVPSRQGSRAYLGLQGQARQVVTSITTTGPAGMCSRYCSYLAASSPRARSRSSPVSATRPRPSTRTHQSLAQSSS